MKLARQKLIDCNSVTLEIALKAVEDYNAGKYFGEKNIDLDRRGRELFVGGLGRTLEDIR